MSNSSSIKRLIVGVDYGTTFSGISWVFSDATSVEDVQVLDSWGSGDHYQRQVPSRIVYNPRLAWGYDIDPRELAYCWTKLLLDDHALSTEHDDSNLRKYYGAGFKTTPGGKTALDVVSDYLRLLYQHMMKELGRKLSEEILKITPIQFWFTLPALWSVRAQNATLQAASRSGFGSRPSDDIHLVKEPEAAAIASLSHLVAKGPSSQVETGKIVLVCDCGGGTVDLASYEIEHDKATKLMLKEVCVSEAGKCGSTSIDRAFYKLMRERFGPAFDRVPEEKRSVSSKFMKDFEAAKRDYGVSEYPRNSRLNLKINGVEGYDYYDDEDNEVLLTADDMKKLFDPVVKQILGLLQKQISATEQAGRYVNTIVLVGGFGTSPYLYKKVKEWCPEGISVFNPPKSWEAICVGAAVRGLQGEMVREKKSRSHVGYMVTRAFKEGIDPDSAAHYDFLDRKVCYDGVDWVTNKGDTITTDTTKRRSLFWDGHGDKKIYELELYESTADTPPELRTHPSVIRVGTLIADLSSVDYNIFDSKQNNNGQKWYKVSFELVFVVEDQLGYMHFSVVVQGKVVGRARLRIDKLEERAVGNLQSTATAGGSNAPSNKEHHPTERVSRLSLRQRLGKTDRLSSHSS